MHDRFCLSPWHLGLQAVCGTTLAYQEECQLICVSLQVAKILWLL
jgi:hypothetical protein